MIYPEVVRREDGSVAVEGLFPLHVAALLAAPGLLGPDAPDEVKRRLFPDPSDDSAHRADWDRLVRPELYALLASAREILERDLAGLAPADPFKGIRRWRIEIPAQHVNAWIGALNAARLALGAEHRIESEEDLHPGLLLGEGRIEIDARTLAVLKIGALAEIQSLLILEGLPENERPPAPEMEGPGEEEDYG